MPVTFFLKLKIKNNVEWNLKFIKLFSLLWRKANSFQVQMDLVSRPISAQNVSLLYSYHITRTW